MTKVVFIVEALIVIMGLILIVTQIIYPIAAGRKLFPILRSKPKAVENELAQLREDIEVADRERQMEEIRSRLAAELASKKNNNQEQEEGSENERSVPPANGRRTAAGHRGNRNTVGVRQAR